MNKILLLFCAVLFSFQAKAQPGNEYLNLKIVDEKHDPVFGVYVSFPRKMIFLTASNIDGECLISTALLSSTDTLEFQGIGYLSQKRTVRELQKHPLVCLKELKYELPEARVTGLSTRRLLELVSGKLKKMKASRIPLCRYCGPVQYEKITLCQDTVVEYRKEYGLYFTSGNVQPYNFWDKTFRSYFVPEYIARSYNLTLNAQDTLIPLFLTSGNSRYDIGTRKIFTLFRAIQLYGPLFAPLKHYDIQPVETDSLDYTFSFKTRPKSYPDQIRISCKGTFTVDRNEVYLKSINFDYIDYQLLRQILISNQRKTASPFCTKAKLTFAVDSNGQHYIRSCHQTTSWKYDLSENFLLIEQPSRDFPGQNRLVEEEAFYYYKQNSIPPALQTSKILSQIHLAHRYPTGAYSPEVFRRLPQLLDIAQAHRDLSRYMKLEDQFKVHHNIPYYPENYLLDSDIDVKERANYLKNLYDTRRRLFDLFNSPAFSVQKPHTHPRPNK